MAPAVGDCDLVAVGALDAGDAGTRRPVMQTFERGPSRPMDHPVWRQAPQATRHLFDAAHDKALVLVAVGDHDAQDFQHRVRKVRIPAPGAEADLAEDLPVVKGFSREGIGRGDEVVEAAVVPDRHQLVPDLLHPCGIAFAHGLSEVREASTLLQCLGPAVLNLAKHRRQLLRCFDVDRLAFEIDDRRWRCR